MRKIDSINYLITFVATFSLICSTYGVDKKTINVRNISPAVSSITVHIPLQAKSHVKLLEAIGACGCFSRAQMTTSSYFDGPILEIVLTLNKVGLSRQWQSTIAQFTIGGTSPVGTLFSVASSKSDKSNLTARAIMDGDFEVNLVSATAFEIN